MVARVLPTAPTRRRWAWVVAVAVLWVLMVSAAGMRLTTLGPWYNALVQPPWKPPDLWFGPAWALIFIATAVAGVRAWMASATARQRAWLLAALVLNSVLNLGWSALFFTLRRPDWALLEWVALWLSIVLLVVLCWRRERLSGALMVVYLAWVSFAGILNGAVVRLNAPFAVGSPADAAHAVGGGQPDHRGGVGTQPRCFIDLRRTSA